MLRNTQPQQLDAAQSLSKSDWGSRSLKPPTSAFNLKRKKNKSYLVFSCKIKRATLPYLSRPRQAFLATCTGQKKQEALASAMHVLKPNTKTTSLVLFSCTQTWWNLWERGGLNRANKNMGNMGEKNKCKGNGSILTIWAEVIYQNDLLDEAGRGAVQDATGIQRGKRQSPWVAKIMTMAGLTQVCCTMHYSRNNKRQWKR